jgi:predicted dehydrogenase
MPFNYEYGKRLRVGYIGAGEHSYRNVLPSLQYAPIELVALADHHAERGLAVARQFGARHFYPNHKAMLAKEAMDAVLIVVGPDVRGRPRYPELGAEALRAGFHTWVDAPPCASAADITSFTEACIASHKYVVTGFKRMFAPAYRKVTEIVEDPAFGGASSFALRYPLSLPSAEQRANVQAVSTFLDFVQPYSLLLRLFGECEGLSYLRSGISGGAVISFRYRKGLVGTLHLTAGQAATSPLERFEVIGNGANVVVENGIRLLYYRQGGRRGQDSAGPVESFVGPDEGAPILWEPDFSLGQLYNKQLFLEGYVGCVRHFAERLLAGEPPKFGNLVEMMHIMTVYDKIRNGKEGEWINLY